MKDRKKMLFLIMCYLLVCLMMIGNFSLARYKKDIKAEALLPKASNFQGSMALSPISSDVNLDYKFTMTGLMPGKTAKIKKDNNEAASLKFTVKNYANVDTSGVPTDVSQTPLAYNIRVYGERHIPLSLLLVHGGKEYPSTCKINSSGYVYTFEIKADGAKEADEVVFDMIGDAPETDEFVVYIGWTDANEWQKLEGYIKDFQIKSYDSNHYEKEVENLEFRAIVRGAYIGTDLPSSAPAVLPGKPIDSTTNVEAGQ